MPPWPASCCLCLLLLLLLMAAVGCSSDLPLRALNPWLSAADSRAVYSATDYHHHHLQQQSRPAAPSTSATLCPPPCNNNNNMTQCLYYLQESHKEEVCGRELEPERRRARLHGLRMRHCCEHAVDGALPEVAFHQETVCRHLLEALLHVDRLADGLLQGHADLLTRYDCAQNYSIAHDCKDCKWRLATSLLGSFIINIDVLKESHTLFVSHIAFMNGASGQWRYQPPLFNNIYKKLLEAYRRWVCSSLVPHYTRSGQRVRPCLSVCEDVEQQCPYLLPDQTVLPGEATHPPPAGEPTFLCLDPNIPESGEQRLKSSRGDEDCCYTHCGSPGRGGGETGVGVTGAAGGGNHHHSGFVLGICEHCPGRPSSAAAVSRAARRTFNQVWTTTALLFTFLQTENVFRAFLRCLLYSVRTVYRRVFFEDRTHRS